MDGTNGVVGGTSASRLGLADSLARARPGCRPETIGRLVETARIRAVRAGEHAYRQGEPVPLTLIVEGFGAARRTTANSQVDPVVEMRVLRELVARDAGVAAALPSKSARRLDCAVPVTATSHDPPASKGASSGPAYARTATRPCPRKVSPNSRQARRYPSSDPRARTGTRTSCQTQACAANRRSFGCASSRARRSSRTSSGTWSANF